MSRIKPIVLEGSKSQHINKAETGFNNKIRSYINNSYLMKNRPVTRTLRKSFETLFSLESDLKKREIIIAEKEKALQERDAALRVMEKALLERDEARKDLDIARKDSFVDCLTGCYNRNYFEKLIDENDDCANSHNKIGFIFIDINDLKQINDEQGHEAGDELIVNTAEFLKSNFRKDYDVVMRIGGDEFVVFCYNYRDTENFENNLKLKMERHCSVLPLINFSYGVAAFDRSIDRDLTYTVVRADKLMYAHKQKIKWERKRLSESVGVL